MEKCGKDQDDIKIEILKYRQSLYKPEKPPEDNSDYRFFIGINPPPESISFEALWQEAVERMAESYDSYILCIEQNTKTMIRPHIHALVCGSKSNSRPNREINRLKLLFKLKSECIFYRGSTDPKINKKRQDYIMGIKQEEKNENNIKDRKDRLAFNIPDYYMSPSYKCLENITVDLCGKENAVVGTSPD